MRTLEAALAFALVVLGASGAGAFPQFIAYQGRYLNAGVPGTGTVSLEFRVTNGNAVACGSALPTTNLSWTSGAQTIALSSGVFSYKLGLQSDQAAQDPAFLNVNWSLANTTYYIDVCAGGVSLAPHDAIGASVYSIYSSSAGALSVSSPGKIVIADGTQATGNVLTSDANGVAKWATPSAGGGSIAAASITAGTVGSGVNFSGNVGVGTTSPATLLDVNGAAQFGSGAARSTFTAAGGLFIASGSSMTLSGADGFVASASSVTASAFFGDGSHLSNLSGSLSGGTANYISKWNGTNSETVSNFYETASSDTALGSAGLGVTYGVTAGSLTVMGNVGIGTSSPNSLLQVKSLLTFDNTHFNVWVGSAAGDANTTGASNAALGYGALYYNTTGSNNTASGQRALYSNTTGSDNTASGRLALNANTTGMDNTASGFSALIVNATGSNNTASGSEALFNNTSGNSNTANGEQALFLNTTGKWNTASGQGALYNNTTANENTAGGVDALFSNVTGNDNTANGFEALQHNTNASNNTAAGAYALSGNTTGGDNTAVGTFALLGNTSGSSNTVSGFYALASNVSGSSNTVIGFKAFFTQQSGNNNTAVGANAGSGNSFTATSSNNSLFGANAGQALYGGSGNVFMGFNAGLSAVNAGNAILIGSGTDDASDNSNFLNIGNVLYGDLSTGHIGIGTSNTGFAGLAVMSGNVGIGTAGPQATLDVNGFIKLKVNTTDPTPCNGSTAGSIALSQSYNICVCNSTAWIYKTSDGSGAGVGDSCTTNSWN